MDANFVDDVPDYLKCVVCLSVMKDPVFFTECSHRLCRQCYTNLVNHTGPRRPLLCPLDRTVINRARVVGDTSISRAILDLRVTCRHSADGCAWVGELRVLEGHLLDRCCFTRLEKFMQKTEEKLLEKDMQISRLTNELQHSRDRIGQLEELQLAREGVNVLEDAICRRNSSLGKRDARGERVVRNLMPQLTLRQVEQMMNVQEYMPNHHTIFKWEIKNYSVSKKTQMQSEKFSPRQNGHSCVLTASFCLLGNLSVAIHGMKDGTDETISNSPFEMMVEFWALDSTGRKMRKPPVMVKQFSWRPVSNLSEGFYSLRFLKCRELENYVINDTLCVICCLYELGVPLLKGNCMKVGESGQISTMSRPQDLLV